MGKSAFYFLLAAGLILQSCGIDKKASKSFELGKYQTSIDLYQQILKKNPNDGMANYYVAESYRLSNRMDDALPYYEKAIAGGVANDSIGMNYAFALKANQQYDQALTQMNNYLASATALDLTRAELVELARTSFEASFAPPEQRAGWIHELEAYAASAP